MNRDQMTAHLSLRGWRPVMWSEVEHTGVALIVITHRDYGAWFHVPSSGSVLEVHYAARQHIETRPELPWVALPFGTLLALFNKLEGLGLV